MDFPVMTDFEDPMKRRTYESTYESSDSDEFSEEDTDEQLSDSNPYEPPTSPYCHPATPRSGNPHNGNPFEDPASPVRRTSSGTSSTGTLNEHKMDPLEYTESCLQGDHPRKVKFDTPKQIKRFSRMPSGDENDPTNLSIGDEPGICLDTMTVDLPDSQGSHIVVIDYSPHKFASKEHDIQVGFKSIITGSTDTNCLHRNIKDVIQERPKWSKVRWVVVNGLSWEALKPLAEVYKLHPLAVEDMLEGTQRTKSEVFQDQVFCCFPMHNMQLTQTPFTWVQRFCRRIVIIIYSFLTLFSRKQPSADSKEDFQFDDDITCEPFYSITGSTTCASESLVSQKLERSKSRSMYDYVFGNEELKNEALQFMHIPGTKDSLEVNMEQVSLFVMGDTIITFFEKNGPKIQRPIEKRLKQGDTLLRHTSDPLILLQAIFDANVDLFGPILKEYRSRLSIMQIRAIKQPSFRNSRALHALITDLTILRPPLDSLSALVEAFGTRTFKKGRNNASRKSIMKLESQAIVHRTISPTAALYFSDVQDHTVSYLHDVDNMRSQSLTLSSLVFNTISIRAGDSVRMLSLVSVVFLPLTFLTGYFGMNFTSFDMLDNDVGYYWLIASPATVILTAIVMYSSALTKVRELWSWSKDQV